jgi:type II secretory pathway component PulL
LKRKLLLLNFVLLVVAAALGWRLRQQWTDARQREEMEKEQSRRLAKSLPPPPVLPAVNPVR